MDILEGSVALKEKETGRHPGGDATGPTQIRGVGEALGLQYFPLVRPGWLNGISAHAIPHLPDSHQAILPLSSFL